MKTIRVVAAVIKAMNDNGEKIIFATERGYGEFKGGWEFPGGKIEAGETPQEALKREIMENWIRKLRLASGSRWWSMIIRDFIFRWIASGVRS